MSQIKINTSPYQNAHRKSPRGRGWWIFEIHTTEGVRNFAYTGLYREAARAAIAEAKTHGAAFRSITLGA